MERSEAAEFGFVELTEFRSDVHDHERTRLAHSESDALVDGVISEELAALRDAFSQGAEFAVTRMDSPRDRVMHRLECPAMEKHLDRHAQWSDHHRTRLVADRSYRLALPTLVTRESARRLTGVRSCKVCWPNVQGNDPRPLRRLTARGLRPHHVGHVLSTDDGGSLGTIVRAAIQARADQDGRKRESVEVVTSSQTFEYSPAEHVFIWDLPTDDVVIERKMQLFERLGSGLTQAH
jgi:hypothetical protein